MNTYLKEEIGVIQLSTSIELFYKNNFVSALTLGAIAEELFATLLKINNKETGRPIPTAAEIDGGMFKLFEDLLGIENYYTHRYKIKNELKHHGKPHNEDIVIADFEQDARTLISGAIINYKFLKKRIPDIGLVQYFCDKEGLYVNLNRHP